MVRILMLAIIMAVLTPLHAQVLPQDGDTVNYRLAGFYDHAVPPGNNYLLEVAEGVQTDDKSFNKNIIISQRDTTGKIIATVPQFGKPYTWRISLIKNKNKVIQKGSLHTFVTGKISWTDTSKYKVDVLKKATHHRDLLVFLNDSKTLHDMEGNTLWYLPPVPNIADEYTMIRDLKPTASGTITFLGAKIAEVDYGGHLLWYKSILEKNDKDSLQFYHHEFTKLDNGHYMVAIHKSVLTELSDAEADTGIKHLMPIQFRTINGKQYRQFPFGSLIEFDSAGNVVWRWEVPASLIADTSFIKKIPATIAETTPHMNSFYFDRDKNAIYISYRNAGRILKISYPSGKVLAFYNGNVPDGFRGQHNVSLNAAGNMMLFNNNYLDAIDSNAQGRVSQVCILEEDTIHHSFKKIWSFACDIDTMAKPNTGTGGGVVELQDGCMIAAMGTAGRVFIVDKNKNLVWNALSREKGDNWVNHLQYRASVIENKEALRKIIFHEITK